MHSIVILTLIICDRFRRGEACPLEYHVTDPNHSFCSQPMPGATELPLSSTVQQSILQWHNDERALVPSYNMEKMYWNDDLAKIALHYARTCVFEHDTASRRSVPRIPLSTGQNLAMGYDNWTQAIQGWIEEKEHYHYGYPSAAIVSHYTQMIWHSTVLVGCASALCPPSVHSDRPWPFYVCNYITGQLDSDVYPPYKQDAIHRPLQDCRGRVCLYNGTLDLRTCQCQCSSYASGPQCERLNCAALPPCYYPSSQACIAVNVPLECPRLCGLCDRYDVLKQLYGDDHVAPVMSSTARSFVVYHRVTKKKTIARRLKKKLRSRLWNSTKLTTPLSRRDVSTTATGNSSNALFPVVSLIVYVLIFYCSI